MEFVILPKSLDGLPEKFCKPRWTVEDCEEYVKERGSLARDKSRPLREVMKGARFDISEPAHVQFCIVLQLASVRGVC